MIIGVGITPGVVSSPLSDANPRFDRSFELDSMTDRFPRFVIEEVLPAVEKHSTPDGRAIYLSRDPNDRGAAGGSTGGIAAFNLAWQRPDSFRRVFSAIGTFVGMRGGERYYVLVRKTEPKPLRVFLEDGVHDVCIPEIGDWWMSNQTMARALGFAGYAVNHAWGAGTHSTAHAAAIFSGRDALVMARLASAGGLLSLRAIIFCRKFCARRKIGQSSEQSRPPG